jgi:biopolymer transport protein TolQ
MFQRKISSEYLQFMDKMSKSIAVRRNIAYNIRLKKSIRKGVYSPFMEISVYNLIVNATFFTKLVLLILLVFSIISWAIMIHKFFLVKKYKTDISQFLLTISEQTDFTYIEASCVHHSKGKAKAIPLLMLKMIHASAQGKPVLSPESTLNGAVMNESSTLQQGMGLLATAASISPLLGLLGTVWGVMYSFISIGEKGTATIATVAPGIAEALMATIGGLLVAIPAMAGHHLLSGYINQSLDRLDRINEFAVSLFSKEMHT